MCARTFLHIKTGEDEINDYTKRATMRASSEPPMSGPRPAPHCSVDYAALQERLHAKPGTWSLAEAMSASEPGPAAEATKTKKARGSQASDYTSTTCWSCDSLDSLSVEGDERELEVPLRLVALQQRPGTTNGSGRDASDDDKVLFQPPGADKIGGYLQEDLHAAVMQNDTEAERRLLDSGADPNAVIGEGMHILFRAVMSAQRLPIVKLLLEAGADVKWKDARGGQVLHFLAHATTGQEGLVHITQLLLDAGAEVNAQRDDDGIAPLHRVLTRHKSRRTWLHFHQARLLIQHGADPQIRTHSGQTPLSMLVRDQRITTYKLNHLLEAEGASMPGCDRIGCPWCPAPHVKAIQFTQQGSL